MTLDDRLTVRHTPRGSDVEALELLQPTGVLPAAQSVWLTSLPCIIANNLLFPVESSADADKRYSKTNTTDMLDSITEFIELVYIYP
jgi:hypothetical protein